VERSFFLAFLATTGVLTTAVAAQEGGDPPLQFCRPLVSGISHLVDDMPVSDVNQCTGDPTNPDQCGAHCTVDISGATVGGRVPISSKTQHPKIRTRRKIYASFASANASR
jgi:hypothetical protein